ncbi:hypothetical protein EJ076_10745 [Mesorhizobium sp. M7D.F.Ca.US.005.01.1.1]|uniref:zinc ribbon domain-containing protein n=1 Tax=Mesorhizobium sp. M7D.F.Ca.US.005.01.1.1 TaxID=2493678 RepID=UPI000F753C32|nr:zinc ribbon domain-containing protein [Mesorhizobium sp. M7D.F.Ca.US.005.01.1.1]AZO41540.1 hypothetical protein EJ076_10745 [Mesorhizobium sp. M7D.F.Ca.US.005.01.1.1]
MLFETTTAGVRAARAKRLHAARRPVSLLSGLLSCGCCGGKYGLILRDRFGCLNHNRRGTCNNNRTIVRARIEERVLSGLKDRLVCAESVAEAVSAYAEEMNRLNRERRAQAQADRKAREKIEGAIAGIIAAIEDGMYQPVMKARMGELERQKAEIIGRMAEAPADMPDVHPNIANIYRIRVVAFAEALNDTVGGREAAEALRSLIGEVVLSPGSKRGEVIAELRGELIGILDFASPRQNHRIGEVRTKVEACPRNQTKRHRAKVQGGGLIIKTP